MTPVIFQNKIMITKKDYETSLNSVIQYRKQNVKDVYEWAKGIMKANTDITDEEFDELINGWFNRKLKEISIKEFNKNKFG